MKITAHALDWIPASPGAGLVPLAGPSTSLGLRFLICKTVTVATPASKASRDYQMGLILTKHTDIDFGSYCCYSKCCLFHKVRLDFLQKLVPSGVARISLVLLVKHHLSLFQRDQLIPICLGTLVLLALKVPYPRHPLNARQPGKLVT